MVNLPKQFIALSNWREVKIYWTSFIWIVRVSKIWKLLNHLNSLYATKNKFYYIRFEFMKEKRDNKTNPNSPDVIAFDKSNIIRKIYRIRRILMIFQNMKIYISPPPKKKNPEKTWGDAVNIGYHVTPIGNALYRFIRAFLCFCTSPQDYLTIRWVLLWYDDWFLWWKENIKWRQQTKIYPFSFIVILIYYTSILNWCCSNGCMRFV